MTILRAIAVLALVLLSGTARAADYPAPKESDWIARDFKFHTGEVMPELRLHYTDDRRSGWNTSLDPSRHWRLCRQHAHSGFRG